MLDVKVSSSARKHVEEALLAWCNLNKSIRSFCLECLGRRYRETSRIFLSRLNQGEVFAEDIDLLSRSSFSRKQEAFRKAQQARFWENYAQQRYEYLENTKDSTDEYFPNSSHLTAA